MKNQHEYFMREAINLAQQAANLGWSRDSERW